MKALTKIIFLTTVLLIILVTFAGCVSKKNDTQVVATEKQLEDANSLDTNNTSYNVNVSINISVKLVDNVKNINPNIIKAARTAVFNFYCDRAKLVHYNGYIVNEQMNIFEVKEIGKNSWEVKYRGADTPADGYHDVTVEKEKSGSYKGSMFYSSPLLRGNETF